MAKELVMSNFGKIGLFAAAAFAVFLGVPAASGSGAAPEESLREFQYADRNGDNQISYDEFKQLRETIAGLARDTEEESRANLPVYINGYERHFPRNRIYYLSGGRIILDDQGPSRFYK